MGLRTDARLDLNYILLDAAALRDVTALQFVSTLWAAAVCSVSTVGSCPKRSGLPTSLYLRLGAFLFTAGPESGTWLDSQWGCYISSMALSQDCICRFKGARFLSLPPSFSPFPLMFGNRVFCGLVCWFISLPFSPHCQFLGHCCS